MIKRSTLRSTDVDDCYISGIYNVNTYNGKYGVLLVLGYSDSPSDGWHAQMFFYNSGVSFRRQSSESVKGWLEWIELV